MIQTLDAVLFPELPNLSMTSRPTFSTTVLGNIAGDSQTIINRDLALWEYTLRFKRHSDNWGALIKFFLERRGRGYGFTFFDPFDNKSTDQGGAGKVKEMPDGKKYLVKQYGEFRPYYRVISTPKADTITFSGVGGSPVVQPYTGEVTGATTEGNASFEFVIPVVFGSDAMEIERDAAIGEWQNVTLRELRRFVVAEAP